MFFEIFVRTFMNVTQRAHFLIAFFLKTCFHFYSSSFCLTPSLVLAATVHLFVGNQNGP